MVDFILGVMASTTFFVDFQHLNDGRFDATRTRITLADRGWFWYTFDATDLQLLSGGLVVCAT